MSLTANPSGFKFQSSTSCRYGVEGSGCTSRVFFALLRDLSDSSGWNLLFLQNEVPAQPWGRVPGGSRDTSGDFNVTLREESLAPRDDPSAANS